MTPILEVKNLITRFNTADGTVHAVNDVSFHLNEGEVLGVVGESGCGKSVTMLSLLQLIPRPPGEIVNGEAYFQGRDLFRLRPAELRDVRGGQIGMIFQDPLVSLNPVITVGRQISEMLLEHLPLSGHQARLRTVELLQLVGIPNETARYDEYPHQFSGGMRQRVVIAMALACNPKIVIADEPTTALDVTIQAQLIRLIKQLRHELGMSIIWITHDLGLIASIAQRVVVMYAGFIVEEAPVKSLYKRPQHPYTIGLLGSLPRIDEHEARRLVNINGAPPDLLTEPTGCPFAPRCPYVFDRCWDENPALLPAGPEHRAACWWDVEAGRPRLDS
jgi:oligopeptide transport system ATP-binding protein